MNILCTSKPCDGLFYYSYEYCSFLNTIGKKTKLVVVTHRNFTPQDYINSINSKYIHCKNIVFNDYIPNSSETTLIMGRSMLTLAWLNRNTYTKDQLLTLHLLFKEKLISVYSENHSFEYYNEAIEYFKPKEILDLCDFDVYPNGVGKHFEKRINFNIYKPIKKDIQFKYLFLGTNKEYYNTIEKIIKQYKSHGILTYNEKYVNVDYNNIFVPINNMLGIFETYVYTKDTFDPAPRIIQECKYFNKDIIYLRDKNIQDGGSVYFKREIKDIENDFI
tara:strand:- start:13123 stop:13950 length:828 start_codon:yes stop_codon:yes gene_type:complete